MSKKIHEITQKDLREVMDHAKEYLLRLPNTVRLPGMRRDLTEQERLVLCYMGGAYMVAGKHGVETDRLVVKYEP